MKEKKDHYIIIRVTKSEKESIIKKAGKDITEFVRKMLGLEK